MRPSFCMPLLGYLWHSWSDWEPMRSTRTGGDFGRRLVTHGQPVYADVRWCHRCGRTEARR